MNYSLTILFGQCGRRRSGGNRNALLTRVPFQAQSVAITPVVFVARIVHLVLL